MSEQDDGCFCGQCEECEGRRNAHFGIYAGSASPSSERPARCKFCGSAEHSTLRCPLPGAESFRDEESTARVLEESAADWPAEFDQLYPRVSSPSSGGPGQPRTDLWSKAALVRLSVFEFAHGKCTLPDLLARLDALREACAEADSRLAAPRPQEGEAAAGTERADADNLRVLAEDLTSAKSVISRGAMAAILCGVADRLSSSSGVLPTEDELEALVTVADEASRRLPFSRSGSDARRATIRERDRRSKLIARFLKRVVAAMENDARLASPLPPRDERRIEVLDRDRVVEALWAGVAELRDSALIVRDVEVASALREYAATLESLVPLIHEEPAASSRSARPVSGDGR